MSLIKIEWNNIYNEYETIYLEENNSSSINNFEFRYREINLYKSEIEILLNDIKKWIKDKKEIVILAGNKENSEKIYRLLTENNINSIDLGSINKSEDENINLVKIIPIASLSTGFECYDLNLVVINMAEAFVGTVKKRKTSSTFKQGEKIVFADLKQGDYVVHKTHGIGEFVGVNTIEADGVTKDYIKIKYRNDDMLYVPTNNLDNVRKYIGGGDTEPKIK